MTGPRIGSLCSGYEGLGMAVESVLGGELAWVADNDPGAAGILAHRYPDVPNLGDLTVINWLITAAIEILIAGFPCQDVSQAGARAGLRKGTRSGIWLNIVEAIRVLRPRLVVIENVRGLLTARGDEPTQEHLAAEAARDAAARLLQWLDQQHNLAIFKGDRRRARQCAARTARVMGLHRRLLARCQWHEQRLVRAIGTVLGSLAGLGYDARWAVVSAAEAGAPHRRERVFIVAWPAADTSGGELQRRGITGVLGSASAGEPGQGDQRERSGDAPVDRRSPAADAAGDEPGRDGTFASHGRGEAGGGPWPGDRGAAQDADGATGSEWRQPAPGQAPGWRSRADAGGSGGAPAAAHAECDGREGRQHPDRPHAAGSAQDGGRRRPARRGGDAADPASDGRDEGRPESAGVIGRPDAALGGHDTAADTDGSGRWLDRGRERQGGQGQQLGLRAAEHQPGDIAWGLYGPAIERWESALGRRSPRPTEPGRTGERLSPRFVEWLMGLPDGWVTDVPGLSRNAQLKALGNGVVPAQAALALRLLLRASGLEAAA